MCGIAGLWDATHRCTADDGLAAVRGMTRALRQRGPDDEGFFHDAAAGLALGHRRLSVIDLSPEGHQPMTSASGRFVMVFNGEVYNHAALRRELAGHGATFRGHSDTEAMLAAIEHWGLDAALQRFIGMFAFALWDRHTRTLTLARDRLGIKPLYYGWVGSLFVFGSELKAITRVPGFDNAINRDALCLLLRHNYITAPHSIYQGIRKLVPGMLLSVSADMARMPASEVTLTAATRTWWSAREAAEAGVADRLRLSDSEAADALERVLRDAVALRMEADVPLGAFLSGGVDSSLVVALMQAQSSRPVQTFSIGFHEKGYDEAVHAGAVAKHLGTEHHELYVTAQDALDVVPTLPEIFDEPFSDSSQIPTFLLSQLARRQVTVSLSGDGGDELFGGYLRYFKARDIERCLGWMPDRMRGHAARSLSRHAGFYGSLLAGVNRCLPARARLKRPHSKVGVLASMLEAGPQEQRYRALMSHVRNPAAIVLHAGEPDTELSHPLLGPGVSENIERMMYSDLVTYLPGDILTKVDRASMAVSLEARVPLLDHRVVEFAWRVPLAQKVRRGQGKWLLRQVLYRHVPRQLIDRPKMGFGVPIGAWLRGPLRDWAEALLDERRLREEGYFDPAYVRKMLADHVAGRVNEGGRLWDVLMFQAWLAEAARKPLHTYAEAAA
ncbi:MAG: Asparagine synthetase [glutamine-hydrolyzing] [Rhodanobacteraceae bacterium]|jgi:asparagine synthase (glutamine-hydrolysing)|nr:MAG: Asparagine synthetase [glutamine-hydrolyzing] [Rhodanobacteraceae bacterium]